MSNISMLSGEVMGGMASKTNRIRMRKYWAEIKNMILELKNGNNYMLAMPKVGRLVNIENYLLPYTALNSDPTRVIPILEDINIAYGLIAQIWKRNVEKVISAQSLKAQSNDPEVIKAAIRALETGTDKLLSSIPARLSDLPGIVSGNKLISNARVDLSNSLKILLGKQYVTASDAYVAAAGSTPLPGSTGHGFSPIVFPDSEPPRKDEGMGLALPIALGVGGIGLALALKG